MESCFPSDVQLFLYLFLGRANDYSEWESFDYHPPSYSQPSRFHGRTVASGPSSSAQNWSTPRNAGAIAKKVKSLNSHMIYVSHILLYIMICCYMMYVTLRV